MPTFLLAFWKPIALILVIGGLVAYGSLQTHRLASCKQEFAAFQAQVKALGDIAEAKARAKEKADLTLKGKIDNENSKLRNDNAALAKRMRESSAGRSTVSYLPASAKRPDLACFDRAELDTAVRRYQSDLLGIAEKGAAATVDLDSGKAWIKEQAVK